MTKRFELVAARKAAGMSRRNVADLLDVREITVRCWETGHRTPHERTAQRLAALLGTSVEALGLGIRDPDPAESDRLRRDVLVDRVDRATKALSAAMDELISFGEKS